MIVRLTLPLNQMDESTLFYLGEALRRNKTLQKLDLKFNEYLFESCIPLLDSLTENNTLDEVKFNCQWNKVLSNAVRDLNLHDRVYLAYNAQDVLPMCRSISSRLAQITNIDVMFIIDHFDDADLHKLFRVVSNAPSLDFL